MAPEVGGVPSLEQFLAEMRERESETERFVNENPRTVRIDVDGSVWIKPGAAVAYRGDLKFERLHTLEADSPMHAVLRETAPLVRALGHGRLYCGYHGSHAHVVRLEGNDIVVGWECLLAFESSLTFDAALVGDGVGLAAGGLVAVTLAGSGSFAIVTHGEPLALPVSNGQPVSTDPHATLAWSASLVPKLKTDISWRSAIGHGGHEAIQMFFEGSGTVLVQAAENPARLDFHPQPLKRLAKLLPV